MCPHTPGPKQNSLLIEKNANLVRRLLTPIAMRSDSSVENVHHHLRLVYQHVLQKQKTPMERIGKLWRLGPEERVLQHREIA